MKRYLTIVAVGIVGIGLVWIGGKLQEPSALATTYGASQVKPGLEMQLSGGWYAVGQEPSGPVELTMGLSPGGVLFINCTPTPFNTFNTTGMGTWKTTGPRQFVGTMICYQRDYTGVTQYYEKGIFSMALGQDGNTLEGSADLYIYLQGQDPLEDEPAFELLDLPVVARRIPAE